MNATQVFALLSKAQFNDFSKSDWDCYAGCSSANPKIACVENYDLILDGDVLQINDVEAGEYWQVSLKIEEI